MNEKSANLGLDFEMETEKSSKLSNELDENEKLMDDTQKTLRDRFKTLEDKYERLRILQTDYNSMFTKVRVVSSLSFHFLKSRKLTKRNITELFKIIFKYKNDKKHLQSIRTSILYMVRVYTKQAGFRVKKIESP